MIFRIASVGEESVYACNKYVLLLQKVGTRERGRERKNVRVCTSTCNMKMVESRGENPFPFLPLWMMMWIRLL